MIDTPAPTDIPSTPRRAVFLIMLDTGAAEGTVRKFLRGAPIRGHFLRARLEEAAKRHGATVQKAPPVTDAQTGTPAPLGAVG